MNTRLLKMNTRLLKMNTINLRLATRCKAPYNVPMHKDGPHIIKDVPGNVIIHDGWQPLPAANVNAEEAVRNARTRSMAIQLKQFYKHIIVVSQRRNPQAEVDEEKAREEKALKNQKK